VAIIWSDLSRTTLGSRDSRLHRRSCHTSSSNSSSHSNCSRRQQRQLWCKVRSRWQPLAQLNRTLCKGRAILSTRAIMWLRRRYSAALAPSAYSQIVRQANHRSNSHHNCRIHSSKLLRLWRLVIRSQEKDPVRQASNSLNNKGKIMVHEAVARTNNSSSSL